MSDTLLTVSEAYRLVVGRIGIDQKDIDMDEGRMIPWLSHYANLTVLLTPQELIEDNLDVRKYDFPGVMQVPPSDNPIPLGDDVMRVITMNISLGSGAMRYLRCNSREEFEIVQIENQNSGSTPSRRYMKWGKGVIVTPYPQTNDTFYYTVMTKIPSIAGGGSLPIYVPEMTREVFLSLVASEVAAAVGASDKSGFWFTNGMNVLRAIKGETMFQPPEQGLTPIMKRQMLNSGMQIPQGG